MEVTSTSRRLHVATSARDLYPSILKYGWLKNRGIGRRTKRDMDFQSRVTQTSRECPRFVPLFIFLDIFGY